MPESLSSGERELISELQKTSLSYEAAIAITVLVAREYSRPKSDLIATLRFYPGLETKANAANAVDELLEKNFLVTENYQGREITGITSDVRAKLKELLQKGDGFEEELLKLRRNNDSYVKVVGPLRDSISYSSYEDLLRTARDRILMPCVMTDPEGLQSVEILTKRAGQNVKVQILAATPKLASKLRGASQEAISKEVAKKWSDIAKKHPNIEFRITGNTEDLLFATSILIDDDVLRLILHDPFHERSKEGVVIQFNSKGANRLNAIADFELRFTRAWKRSREPGALGWLKWFILDLVPFSLAALFFGLSILAYSLPENIVWLYTKPVKEFAQTSLPSIATTSFIFGFFQVLNRFKIGRWLKENVIRRHDD